MTQLVLLFLLIFTFRPLLPPGVLPVSPSGPCARGSPLGEDDFSRRSRRLRLLPLLFLLLRLASSPAAAESLSPRLCELVLRLAFFSILMF